MQFGSDDETDKRSLIIDGVRLPFRMQAQVVHGPLEEDRLVDAAGMDRLPVMLQVMLPRALCPPAAPLPALPAPEQARPGLAGKDGTQGPGDVSLLPGSPERHRPVGTAALESLGLGTTLRQRVGGPPSLAGLRDPAPAAAADAGDPADLAYGGNDPAVGTGRATGTSGYRALDVVFSAGRIRTLHRTPPASPAAAAPADDGEDGRASLRPAVDRRVVTAMPSRDAPHADREQASADPIVPIASQEAYPVPSPVPLDLVQGDKNADAAARQLGDLLQELRERVGRTTDDALKVVGEGIKTFDIKGDAEAINDELLSLEYRDQLKNNTLSLLSQVRPDLKDSLNKQHGQTRLEIHHTVPYADPDARDARDLLKKWGLSIHDPADAAIVPSSYHRGENIHGMANKGYSTMVVEQLEEADRQAMAVAGGRKAGRMVMLDAIRALSDKLVNGSADLRAIALEQMLRTLERPLPRPDLADPFDWKGYVP